MKLTKQESTDINEIISDLESKHYRVYWKLIDDRIFIYKPLGRKDYSDIVLADTSIYEKEDEVVLKTVLYPQLDSEDLDEIEAGCISILAKDIMEKSYLSNIETREKLTQYFRSEMENTDNQVTCMINEAFPQFDIEEIENWGLERTAKYFSRAEWKLVNLRNLSIAYEQPETMEEEVQETQQEPVKENSKKLTPQKLAELKRKFPDIDWDNDAVAKHGEAGMETMTVNQTPVAARPLGKN